MPPFVIPVEDLRETSEDARAAALTRLRSSMSHQVLPLDHWPIFDVRLTRMTDGATRIHLSIDAIILDAFSRAIVARDLLRLYARPDVALEPLEIGFRDYVIASRDAERGPAWESAKRYWEARIPTFPAGPELPMRRSAEGLTTPEFTAHTATLEARRWSALQRAAARRGVTGSSLLLAAYAEVLAAWSSSPRFGINVTLFHRLPVHPQVMDIAGDFTTLEILEVERDPTVAFEGLARTIQARLWEDLDHAVFSGVRVLREIRARRQTTGALMPVVFTSTLGLGDGAASAADGFRQVYAVSQTPQVWLDNIVGESATGDLEIRWNAVDALFPEALIASMFEAYVELLEDLAIDAERWSDRRAPVLPRRERALRDAVNATTTPRASKTLEVDVLAAARRAPSAPAVLWSGGAVSYEELGQRIGALTSRLSLRELAPGEPIAVLLPKGWRQVVAVLAVLAAGGAYVPLDPSLPHERIAHVLEATGARIAITDSASAAHLALPGSVTVFREEDGSAAPLPPPAELDPARLAYVIFTSGSTGKPKGVMIDHRGATNTIDDLNRRFAVSERDRIFSISSLSFDLSVYDIFGLLAAGGAVVVPDPDGLREVAHWSDLVRRHGVTIWNSVPALMQLYVEYLEQHRDEVPTTLRLVMLSGDWIPVSLPDRIRALMPSCKIVSLGGATEASIWSILHPIGAVDPGAPSIPYGRAMENQTFEVLDDRLLPRPEWVAGELYIGGIGVALGYWGDPQRTADQFITHPDTGERLYRTGDWGRWLPGGEIEFLGRQDGQVKIQGYRVELGEIEAAAREVAAGRELVAFASGPRERRRLALAIAQPEGAALDVAGIKRALSDRLPAYMVPHVVLRLDRLPLSSNGKVDRAVLARLVEGEPAAETPTAPAETSYSPMEREIAMLLEAVLGFSVPGPLSNLLELGADSVGIIRAANRLEERFGSRPRLVEVYRDPTVRGLARSFTAAAPAKVALPTRESPTGSGTPHLLVDPAERDRHKAAVHHALTSATGAALPLGNRPAPAAYARRSVRSFGSTPVGASAVASMLAGGAAHVENGIARFMYASAGGVYPVTLYVYLRRGRVDGLQAGLHRYDPVRHALVALAPDLTIDPLIFDPLLNASVVESSAVLTFLVSRDRAIRPLYGDKSTHFAAIEAGLLSAELERRGADVGLACCHIGSFEFDAIKAAFELEEGDELVHTLAWGPHPTGPTGGPATAEEREVLEL